MAQYIFGILILVLLFREILGYKELEKGINEYTINVAGEKKVVID